MNRGQRSLLVGDLFSAFGSWIDYLAILTIAAYTYSVSPHQMALVVATSLLPGMLAARAIGRYCDEKDASRALRASLILRVVATIALLFAGDFMMFLLVTGIRSIGASASPIAINVLAVRATGDEDAKRFFARLNVVNNMAKIAAPLLGGALAVAFGEGASLVLSAALSALAILFFAMGRLGALPNLNRTDNANPGTPRLEVSAFGLCAVTAVYFFIVFLANNHLPLVLKYEGFDKDALGVLIGSSGLGNVFAGLWHATRPTGSQARKHMPLRHLAVAGMAQAVGFVALATLLWFKLGGLMALALLFVLIGLASASFAIFSGAYIASHFSHSAGAVSARVQVTQNLMVLIAPLIGASILNQFGGSGLFAFAGVVGLVGFIATMAAARASKPPEQLSAVQPQESQ